MVSDGVRMVTRRLNYIIYTRRTFHEPRRNTIALTTARSEYAASTAHTQAKEKDSGVAVFTKELRVRFLERVRYENDLRNAIDNKELAKAIGKRTDLPAELRPWVDAALAE